METRRRIVLHLASRRATPVDRPLDAVRRFPAYPAFRRSEVTEVEKKDLVIYQMDPMLLGALRVVRHDFESEMRALWVVPHDVEAYPAEHREALVGEFPAFAEELGHNWEVPLKLGLPGKTGWKKDKDAPPFLFHDLSRAAIPVQNPTGMIIHPVLVEAGRRDRIRWFRVAPDVVVRRDYLGPSSA